MNLHPLFPLVSTIININPNQPEEANMNTRQWLLDVSVDLFEDGVEVHREMEFELYAGMTEDDLDDYIVWLAQVGLVLEAIDLALGGETWVR